MKVTYTENEKRHILESSTGYVATYLKTQLSKEEAEQAFKLALKMQGGSSEVTEEKEFTEFAEVEISATTEETPARKNGKK
jgi:hypothetical protein